MNFDEEKAYRMREAIELIKRYLPLGKWGFTESSQSFYNKKHPKITYASEKCRIQLHHNTSGRQEDHIMIIEYGRLDTPDQAGSLRVVHLDNFHLFWHSVRLPLYFLDGLSPHEAELEKYPHFIQEFKQSKTAREINYWPEENLAKHAAIWEAYGPQLFDLFDSRNESLWKRYSEFVREYRKAPFSPNS